MQAVSGITPDLRTSYMAPNPPSLDWVLAISRELSVWEMTASYSCRQKEKNRHCPEGKTSGAVQESCCKVVCGVETMKRGYWILMMQDLEALDKAMRSNLEISSINTSKAGAALRYPLTVHISCSTQVVVLI